MSTVYKNTDNYNSYNQKTTDPSAKHSSTVFKDLTMTDRSKQIISNLYLLTYEGNNLKKTKEISLAKRNLRDLVSSESFKTFTEKSSNDGKVSLLNKEKNLIELLDMVIIPQVNAPGTLVACKNVALQNMEDENIKKGTVFYTVYTLRFSKKTLKMVKLNYRSSISDKGFEEMKALNNEQNSNNKLKEFFKITEEVFSTYGTLSYTDDKSITERKLKEVHSLVTEDNFKLLFGNYQQQKSEVISNIEARYSNSLREPIGVYSQGGADGLVSAIVFLRQSTQLSKKEQKGSHSGKKYLWVVTYDKQLKQIVSIKQVDGLRNLSSGLNVPNEVP